MKRSAVLTSLTGAAVLSVAAAVYAGTTMGEAPPAPKSLKASARVPAPPAPPAVPPVAPAGPSALPAPPALAPAPPVPPASFRRGTLRCGDLALRNSGETIVVESGGATWVIEDPAAVERIRKSIDGQVRIAREMGSKAHELVPAMKLAEAMAAIDHEAIAKSVEASIDHDAIAEAVEAATRAAALAMEGFDEDRLEGLSERIERSVARAMRESERSLRAAGKQGRAYEVEMRRFEREMETFELQMEKFEREMESLGERMEVEIDSAVRREIERGNARRIE